MPTVILRGSKQQGRKVSRLVLEGSSSNPVRYGDLNGAPFEVTDDELAKLERSYTLEPFDIESANPSDTVPPPQSRAEVAKDDDGDDNEDDET